MSAQREDARKALAVLFGELLGNGQSDVKAIYNHMPADFKSQSPVIVVSSGGSTRGKITFQAVKSAYRVIVTLLVAYPAAGDAQQEHEVETQLDEIEERISDIVHSHNKTDQWKALSYADITSIGSVLIGGKEYRQEVIPLAVEVY